MIERIAYIGNFSHPWCTEVHIADTLTQMDIQVDRIQENAVDLSEIEVRANASDALLYTRTWGVKGSNEDVVACWRRLEERGVITASYHLDLYYGINRQRTVVGDPFWSTSVVFTPDGDPKAAEWFKGQGINHHWLKPGVYADECKPGRPDPQRFPHSVVFVGSWRGYHKEWGHRKKLVNHLQRRWRDHVGVYGHDSLGTIRGWPLNDLYATASVVVGDSLCPGYTKRNYWSDRVYETLGRGGYLLHPDVPGLRDEFTEDHLSFYPFGDFKHLDFLIERALDEPDRFKAVARRGQEFVSQNYTYTHRLREVLGVLASMEG